MLISFALIIVGAGIFLSGVKKVLDSINGVVIEQPGFVALVVALISIITKEGLFWYTKIVGLKEKSQAVIANAWHHRSDAFSSIGTALGISGAIFFLGREVESPGPDCRHNRQFLHFKGGLGYRKSKY